VITLKRIFLLLALGACLAATGCGSDDEGGKKIPAATAAALQQQLNSVQDRLDNGTEAACKDILSAEDANDDAVTGILNSLPNDVDPDVRDALQESFDNLWSLVESKCQNLQPDEPAQTETQTQTQTEETPTETTPPATETTPPATETTPPATETNPPEGNGNNGGAIPPDGNGGGVGPGATKEKKEKGE
jgi:outer membrane murein-binding lipoprotein Lpp